MWKPELLEIGICCLRSASEQYGSASVSSSQSSWLQIQRSKFDSRLYQIFWKVVGLERGPLSLVSPTGDLPERKSSGSGLENREYDRRDLSRWPRCTLYPQKLALTSPTSGGPSVGIVRSRSQTMEFSFSFSQWYEGESFLRCEQPLNWWRNPLTTL
jgi:hypothetical protein